MRWILLIIFTLACTITRHKHKYKLFSEENREEYKLIVFRCQDYYCYKLDTFKLYKNAQKPRQGD